ncbi:hypothetical protein QVD17_39680 [Tagetes erecta]|uniref:Uncharacterized protein n=1 Tax=Tagetes erecta TaxID=13708 RepID=A0AAD8NFJ5_TARER|nr:hypothetical protein QVD17_39680 [Tagetes erecta]
MHKHYEYLRNFSKSPRILSRVMKRYIKDILSMGILLEDDKREIIGDIVETMLATEDGTSTGMCKRGEGETEMVRF